MSEAAITSLSGGWSHIFPNPYKTTQNSNHANLAFTGEETAALQRLQAQEGTYLPLKARPYFSHPLLLQQQATWHQLARHSQAAQKEYNFTKLPAASSPLPDMHVLVT